MGNLEFNSSLQAEAIVGRSADMRIFSKGKIIFIGIASVFLYILIAMNSQSLVEAEVHVKFMSDIPFQEAGIIGTSPIIKPICTLDTIGGYPTGGNFKLKCFVKFCKNTMMPFVNPVSSVLGDSVYLQLSTPAGKIKSRAKLTSIAILTDTIDFGQMH